MPNLSEALLEKGWEEGWREGVRKATLNCLSKLMAKMKLDAGQAFEVLDIPADDRREYLNELQRD